MRSLQRECLGDGHTTNHGAYRDVVARGIRWFKSRQDLDTGLIGDDAAHDFVYDHAIAALTISEACYFSKSPTLKGTAQKAINYIARARDPYLAWRYDVPSNGDNDTSVTGWMVLALTSAKEAGLKVDPTALEGAGAAPQDAPRMGPRRPLGYSGGRNDSTATMVLCLEVYYRYGKLLGAR